MDQYSKKQLQLPKLSWKFYVIHVLCYEGYPLKNELYTFKATFIDFDQMFHENIL